MSTTTAPQAAAETVAEITTQMEQAVLGAVLMSPVAMGDVAGTLKPADFYRVSHEVLYGVVKGMHDAGDPVDAITVAAELASRGELEQVGGAPYLHTLLESVPTASNVDYYARKVGDAAADRRMSMVGTRLTQAGEGALRGQDRATFLADAIGELEGIGAAGGGQAFEQIGAVGEDYLDLLDAGGITNPVTTGLPDLDHLLVGLLPGQVITVGARPGQGKSVMGLHLAHHAASQGRTSLLYSLEMDRVEIYGRLISKVARVDGKRLNLAKPVLTDEDWMRVSSALPKIVDLPLLLNTEEALTPARVSAVIASAKRQHPTLGLVVIDYLQLMDADGRHESRQQEVTAITRAVKRAAKRHQVAIALLAQLNRKVEDRTDKRPQSSDLRESGAVEQDSDVIVMLHREDMYDPESPRAGEIDLIVTKNRNGSTGTATAVFQGHYSRVVPFAREDHYPAAA